MYMARPVELENLTVYNYLAQYRVGLNSTGPSYRDQLWNHICPVSKVTIVYSAITLPDSNSERFFYHQLLLQRSFRSIPELFAAAANQSRTWAEAYYHHAVFRTDEALVEHLRSPEYDWEDIKVINEVSKHKPSSP